MGKRGRFNTWSNGLKEYLSKQDDYLDRLSNNPSFLKEHAKIKALEGEKSEVERGEFCNKWRLSHFPWRIKEKQEVDAGRIEGFFDKNGKKLMFYSKRGKLLRKNRNKYAKELSSPEGVDSWRLIVSYKKELRVMNDLIPSSPNIYFVFHDNRKGFGKGNVKEVRLFVSALDNYTKNAIQHAYKEMQEYAKYYGLKPHDRRKKRKVDVERDFEVESDKNGNVHDVVWLITSSGLFSVRDLLDGYRKYKKLKKQYRFMEYRRRSKSDRDGLFIEVYNKTKEKHPKYNDSHVLREMSKSLLKEYPDMIGKMILEHIRANDPKLVNYYKNTKKKYVLDIDDLPKAYKEVYGKNDWNEFYADKQKDFVVVRDEYGHTALENVIRKAIVRYKRVK